MVDSLAMVSLILAVHQIFGLRGALTAVARTSTPEMSTPATVIPVDPMSRYGSR